MKIQHKNDEHLRAYLGQGGAHEHMNVADFVFGLEEFRRALEEVRSQFPELPEEKQRARAAYRLLTQDVPRSVPAPASLEPEAVAGFWERKRLWVIAWAVAILVLLGAQLAHCQARGITTFERYLADPDQPGGIIIQVQNQGSVLATRPAGLLVLNCSTNMSCSFAGTTFTITSSATAGTAWSSLTNPTVNLSMSHGANTTAFTWGAATGAGVNLFTLTDTLNNTGTGILHRVFTASGSVLTPFQADANGIGWKIATTGNLLPVSTASLAVPGTVHGLVIAQGASAAITTSGTGTAGQVLLSNGSAADPSFGDPQVTGNVASGAADSGNPVKIGGVFNTTQPTVTTGQRVDQQMTARGELLIAKGVTGFSVDNTGFNVNNTPTVVQGNAGSNAQAWWARIGDASNGPAAVKAASTTAIAADPALTVALSPNNLGCAGASIANTKIAVVSLTANTQIITGVASQQTYICAVNLVVGAADNVALVEGTGTTCGTGTAGMAGGATAATGWNFAANGGLAVGSGQGIVAKTATAADNICLLVSGTAQVSGAVVYAQF